MSTLAPSSAMNEMKPPVKPVPFVESRHEKIALSSLRHGASASSVEIPDFIKRSRSDPPTVGLPRHPKHLNLHPAIHFSRS